MDVETLTLVDKGAARECEIYDIFLGDLPNSFIELLDILGNFCDILNGAVILDKFIFDRDSPKILFFFFFSEEKNIIN